MPVTTTDIHSPLPEGADLAIWRISIERYHEMIRCGALTEDDPVELLEGYLVEKMPRNPPHHTSTRRVRRALEAAVDDQWIVDSQEAVTLGDSEPEPDVCVIRGDEDEFAQRNPGPSDIGLLVEVSDESLRRDRGPKKRIYAQAAIPIYWIVNLRDRQVEVYTSPTGAANDPDYSQRADYREDDEVPLRLDGREVARITVRDLLP